MKEVVVPLILRISSTLNKRVTRLVEKLWRLLGVMPQSTTVWIIVKHIVPVLLLILMFIYFIYCNWVSCRWQRSVDFYKTRKETAQKVKQYTKQYKTHTEYAKWKTKVQNKKQTKGILKKNISRVIRKWQIEAKNNESTYCTEPTYSYITINQW